MPDRVEPRRPVRVLELRSVRGTGGGPEKTILASAGLADPERHHITVCYIRDERDGVFAIGERAAGRALDYVEIRERHSFDRRIWPALRDLVRDRQIDIVHAHEYKTDLLALLLARSTGVIPLSTAHGWTGHSARERYVYYPLDRRLLVRFPAVIAVSEQIRRTLIRAGARPERVMTILNGIDHRIYRRDRSLEAGGRSSLGFQPDDLVIGAVGRLEPQKRFDLLIETCATLQPRWPRLRLAIVGDGSLRASLESQAVRVLRPGTWMFPGHVDDVGRIHHGLDLLVQSSDYEGTPNAVLEAMAFETPVVATAAGGTAELVRDGETALVVSPGDVGALTTAVEDALTRRDAAIDRARAARHRVEHELSFEHRTRCVERVYDDLVERFGPRSATGAAYQWA